MFVLFAWRFFTFFCQQGMHLLFIELTFSHPEGFSKDKQGKAGDIDEGVGKNS